jgi:hypothetical protein
MCTYARSSSPASGSPTAAASIATTAAAAHTARAHLGHLISAAPPSHPFLATGTRAWAVANLQFRRFLQPTNGDGTETSSPRAGREEHVEVTRRERSGERQRRRGPMEECEPGWYSGKVLGWHAVGGFPARCLLGGGGEGSQETSRRRDGGWSACGADQLFFFYMGTEERVNVLVLIKWRDGRTPRVSRRWNVLWA